MVEGDNTLFLDEKNELYGYAVYNTNENCFVDLPETDSPGIATPDHVVREKDKNLLQKVAERHGLRRFSHLRVVEVRLDNELDKQASEKVNECE